MKQLFTIPITLFLALTFGGCGGSSSEDAQFAPFKTASINAKEQIAALAINGNVIAVADSNESGAGYIRLLDADGNHDEVGTIANRNGEKEFGMVSVLGEHYLATANYKSSNVYIYKMRGASATFYVTIPNIEPTNAFGRTLAIDGNHLLVGTFGTDSKSERIRLYAIEQNATATLLHTFLPIEEGSYFGANTAIKSNTIAIAQAKGAKTYLYRLEENGSVTSLFTLIPANAQTATLYHPKLAFENENSLLVAAPKLSAASLFTYAQQPQEQTLACAFENDRLCGSSVAATENTVIIESAKGVTLYHKDANGTFGDAIALEDSTPAAYYANNAMATNTKRFIRKHLGTATASVYEFYAKAGIYIYNEAPNPLPLVQAEPPYALHCVDAASTRGELSYTLGGSDADMFDLNGSCLYAKESHSEPQGSFALSLNLSDSSETVEIPLHVTIRQRTYGVQDTTAAKLPQLSMAFYDDWLLTQSGLRELTLYTIADNTFAATLTIKEPTAKYDFGSALALGADG